MSETKRAAMTAREAIDLLNRGTQIWCGCLVQGASQRMHNVVEAGLVTAAWVLSCPSHGPPAADQFPNVPASESRKREGSEWTPISAAT